MEEIRATGAMLESVLEHEPAFAEPTAGRPVVPVVQQPAPTESKVVRFPQFYYMVSGLAAACFAVFFVYWQSGKPLHEKPKQYVKMELGNAVDAKTAEIDAVAVARRLLLRPSPPRASPIKVCPCRPMRSTNPNSGQGDDGIAGPVWPRPPRKTPRSGS